MPGLKLTSSSSVHWGAPIHMHPVFLSGPAASHLTMRSGTARLFFSYPYPCPSLNVIFLFTGLPFFLTHGSIYFQGWEAKAIPYNQRGRHTELNSNHRIPEKKKKKSSTDVIYAF